MELGLKKPLFAGLAKAGALLGVMGLFSSVADAAEPTAARTAARSGVREMFREPITLVSDHCSVPAPMTAAPAPTNCGVVPPAAGCESGCGKLGNFSLCDLSLQKLFDGPCGTNMLSDNQYFINGNIVQSYTINSAQPADRFNGPVTWTDRANEYQLNQIWLNAGRNTDTTNRDWDIGGNATLMYGTSYRWSTAAGFEDRFTGNLSQPFYGLAVPNLYAEVAYKNTKTKIGRYVSPVGYFTLNTADNFFNTLPYTYQYGEPFTHTGTLTTVTVNDNLSVGGGFTRGWDNWDAGGTGSPSLGAIATVSYTFDNKMSLAWVGVNSREFNNNIIAPGVFDYSQRYLQTLVLTVPVNDCVTYVAQSDLGIQNNAFDFAGTRQIGTARWYGLNQYLFYKQNDLITWGFNFEWFRDESGFRVGSLLPTFTNPSAVRGLGATRFGYAGNFYQITLGPKITPCKNIFIRPNLRFDWFGGQALNPGAQQPFNGGGSRRQAILGIDLGITF